jgi:Protein of unknown function (DUF3040)
MPLSEHEQRMLEQIERALVQDPKFANTVRASNPRTYLIRKVLRAGFVFVLGIVALLVGVGLNRSPHTAILGVTGFVLMLGSGARAVADLKRISGRGTDVTPRRGRRKSRPRRAPFTERLEERWRRRWEERGGF